MLICNFQCGLFVLASRKSKRSIGITSVTWTTKQVSQIHTIFLGEDVSAEAILLPILQLKNTITDRPDCWKIFDGRWAYQDDGCNGSVGQMLIGADCTRLIPTKVTDSQGNQLMT